MVMSSDNPTRGHVTAVQDNREERGASRHMDWTPEQGMKEEDQERETSNMDEPTRGMTRADSRVLWLEDEVRQLRETCTELLQRNRQLQEDQRTPAPKPLLKPRDIPMLEWSSVKGVEGE